MAGHTNNTKHRVTRMLNFRHNVRAFTLRHNLSINSVTFTLIRVFRHSHIFLTNSRLIKRCKVASFRPIELASQRKGLSIKLT